MYGNLAADLYFKGYSKSVSPSGRRRKGPSHLEVDRKISGELCPLPVIISLASRCAQPLPIAKSGHTQHLPATSTPVPTSRPITYTHTAQLIIGTQETLFSCLATSEQDDRLLHPRELLTGHLHLLKDFHIRGTSI